MEEKKVIKLDKKKLGALVRIAVILGLIVGGILLRQHVRTREYKGYEVLSETSLYSIMTGYQSGNMELLLYSNDGAKAIDKNGEISWEISYQLDNPDIVYCKDVAAVADIGGKSVYVVAENGIPHTYEVIYPIVKHEVAEQGVTAVLLDNGKEDFIQLYDMDGNLRVDINTKTKIDGIPIDIALSPDGKKLVTLYMTFQGDYMVCKVTFYNADEVGKNYINNIVEQKTYEDNLLAYDVRFLSDDTLCVLLEKGFALYRMTEVPELICEKNLCEDKKEEKEVSLVEVICVEGGLYAVTEDASKKRTMTFYDTKGEEKSTWKEIPEYESITATKEEVVFFSPQSITIYRRNRSLKYGASFTQSLEAVFPAGSDRYFLVDTDKVLTIKLSNAANEE